MKRPIAVVLLLVLAMGTGSACAQEPLVVGAERFLRLDWRQGLDRKGRPIVEGYVYNDAGRPVEHVRLLVEALDASGQRVAFSMGDVHGIVPNGNRAYFTIKAPSGAGTYRVRVYAFDWLGAQR